MKFNTEHLIYGVSAPVFEKLFFAEELNVEICAALKMHRTLVSRQVVDGQLNRQVTIRPQRDLPAAVGTLLGGRKVAYTETMTYKYGSMQGQWVIEPAIFVDKVQAFGTVGFEDHNGGTLRRVTGEIVVKIFGISSLIERFIVADIERSFAKAAQLTNSYFQNHPNLPLVNDT